MEFNSMWSWAQSIPAESKYDGEQRHQLHQVLTDVGCHDSKLQEEEEEEGQRFVDKVPVHRHLSVHQFGLIEGLHGAVAQSGHAQHHHTCRDTRVKITWCYFVFMAYSVLFTLY